jgi:hypothetical protein
MLTGEDQGRHDAGGGERPRNGFHLDRFRPGPNDQPDVPEAQPSP